MQVNKLISFQSFLLLGLGIAMIPLIVAVVYATIALRDTVSQGSDLNHYVYEETNAIRIILHRVADIERKARLFVLLADPALRQPYEGESYERARTSLRQAIDDFLKLPVDNEIGLLANELLEKEILIYRQIMGSIGQSQPKLPVDKAFLGLREATAALSSKFDSHIVHQLSQFRQQAEAREQGLLIKIGIMLMCFIAAIGMLLGFLRRSMLTLDASIRRLGSGSLNDPIHIAGPSDFHDLGEKLELVRVRFLQLEAAAKQSGHDEATMAENPSAGIANEAAQLGRGDDSSKFLVNDDPSRMEPNKLREEHDRPPAEIPIQRTI